MEKDILVFVETRDGKIQKVGLELLGEARKLASEGVAVKAVLIGDDLKEAVKCLEGKAVDEIIVVEGKEFAHYNTLNHTEALFEVIKAESPNIVFLGATSIGRDLGPRLAARLNCGLTADCTKLEVIDGLLNATRPAFGGNLMATIVCPKHKPQMATVRPGVMAPIGAGKGAKVVPFKVKSLLENNVVLLEEVKEEKKVENIEEAKILVSMGRGIGSDENMEAVKRIAKLLKGTYSSSRALVDEGRVESPRQVGQTGKTVKPELYLALGISGAIQHVVGMENSNFIIAVNRDKGASIFQVADLGIVGDVDKILPLLEKRLGEEISK